MNMDRLNTTLKILGLTAFAAATYAWGVDNAIPLHRPEYLVCGIIGVVIAGFTISEITKS